MKLFIVALMSLCAASAFAQQRNQAPPAVRTSVVQAGTQMQHPVPVEVRHSSHANGVSQERVISRSSVHTAVWTANTAAPVPQQASASGSEAQTAGAMPQAASHVAASHMAVSQAGQPQAGSIILRANEKAPAPAEHLESTSERTQQK